MKKDSEWNSRETWKSLDKKGKIQFFKDYYLWPMAGIIAAAAIVISIVLHILFPMPGPALYVAVYDITLDASELSMLKESFASKIGVAAERIVIDDTFRQENIQDSERLQVLVANHSIDIIIADDKLTKELAGFGNFVDVNEYLDKDTVDRLASDGKLVENSGFDDDYEGVAIDDNGNSKGEVRPYSINIADSDLWEKLSGEYGDKVCDLSIVAGCDHADNAKIFVEELIK